MKRKLLFNILFIFLLIVIPLFIGELLFRYLLFSQHSPFPQLKDPNKYSKTSEDNYWKLHYKFGKDIYVPKYPHPLLGWTGFFDSKTLDHWDMNPPNNNRKVLIYGDSYIMCAHDSIQCFHEILNADTTFNRNNLLLNYGVGGYGVDQIYLLFTNTVDKFENPFVIFSIMPGDMDRCLLSVRDGQKPYYAIENDSLVLKGVPIDPIPSHYFETNPPEITSYLWKRFLNTKLNPYFDPLPTNNELRNKILSLNKKIILRALSDIKKRNLQYVFLIFDELWNEEGAWRVDSLQKFMAEKNILFINTGNLVAEDTSLGKYEYSNYTIHGDGHPNSHYNKLICEEIKKYIFNYNTYPAQRQNLWVEKKSDNSIEYFEKKIRNSPDWLKQVIEKAKARNIPINIMIRMDAIWSHEHSNEKKSMYGAKGK